MPFVWGAIAGGVIGAVGSNAAANTQADAANKATDATLAQNAQTRADNAPWRQQGTSAVNMLGDLTGSSGNTGAAGYGSLTHTFNADDLKTNLAPNYQWQLEQGLGAATNAGNAAGFSGNTLKGINDYAQGYAGNAYQQAFNNYTANQSNIYNRLSNVAGLGQTANQTTAHAEREQLRHLRRCCASCWHRWQHQCDQQRFEQRRLVELLERRRFEPGQCKYHLLPGPSC
jgi:hypothetical protein